MYETIEGCVRDFEVPSDNWSEEACEAFQNGQCHAFALELSKRIPGGEIIASQWSKNNEDYSWNHVAILLRVGLNRFVIDSDGITTLRKWKKKWVYTSEYVQRNIQGNTIEDSFGQGMVHGHHSTDWYVDLFFMHYREQFNELGIAYI